MRAINYYPVYQPDVTGYNAGFLKSDLRRDTDK